MPEPKFDLEQFLPYLLNQAAEASSLAFQQEYKRRYGMLRTEWRVLFHLGLYGQLTASEISKRAKLHKTKVSRAVQHLAELRYLTRARDTEDRRVEHLTLTPRGRKIYAELSQVAARYDAALSAQFTPQEQAVLRRALTKLSETQNTRFT